MTFIRGLGYKKDIPDVNDYKMKVSLRELATLPPSVILNDPTPVLDQGGLGSCVANAGDNVFKLRDSIVTGGFSNGSRLALYFWDREIDGTIDSDEGSYLRTMAKVLADKGVPPEKSWPYIESKYRTRPPTSVDAEAIKSHADTYYRVDGDTPTETLNNIKAAIASTYPVMLGFTVFNNFFNTGSSGNMPMGAGGIAGGHAVTVTGYDDAHLNLDGSKGALFIKNSWGTGWGAMGRFWMPYKYVTMASNYVGDAWEVIDESDFMDPIPIDPVDPTPNPIPPQNKSIFELIIDGVLNFLRTLGLI